MNNTFKFLPRPDWAILSLKIQSAQFHSPWKPSYRCFLFLSDSKNLLWGWCQKGALICGRDLENVIFLSFYQVGGERKKKREEGGMRKFWWGLLSKAWKEEKAKPDTHLLEKSWYGKTKNVQCIPLKLSHLLWGEQVVAALPPFLTTTLQPTEPAAPAHTAASSISYASGEKAMWSYTTHQRPHQTVGVFASFLLHHALTSCGGFETNEAMLLLKRG